MAVGIVVLVALGGGHVAGVDRTAHPAGRVRRDPTLLAPDGRLARRTQCGLAGRPGAGGAGRSVRHPGVGHQPRRAAAGARQQPVGRARLDPAHATADDPRAGLGAAASRCGTAVRRSRGYPCTTGYFIRRSAKRPGSDDLAVGTAGAGAPGHRGFGWARPRSRSSANRSGRARWRASSPTAVCGRNTRPSRSTGWTGALGAPPGAPYLTDTDAMARVDGGPEALLRLDERRRLLDQPPLGPMLLTDDAQAGRDPDAGRHRHRHPAGTRDRLRPRRRPFVGDPRGGRHPAHLQPGARLSRGRYRLWCTANGPVAASRCRVRRRIPPRCPTWRPRPAPTAAIDGDSVHELGVQRAAVGRRPVAAGRLRPPRHQRHHHHHPQRNRRRRAGPPHRDLHRQRHQHAALRRSRASRSRRRCRTARHRGSGSPRSAPTTGRPACSSASPTSPSPSTTRPGSPIRSSCATRSTCQGRLRTPLSHNGIWVQSCWAVRAVPRGPTACTARPRWRRHPRSRSTSAAR